MAKARALDGGREAASVAAVKARVVAAAMVVVAAAAAAAARATVASPKTPKPRLIYKIK